MKHAFIIFTFFVFLHHTAASADDKKLKEPYYPIITRYFDYNGPKTSDEVLNVYPWRVDVRDGVDRIEAKIIAQHELIVKDLDRDYDISKPKIIEENGQQWVVRIPAKFSMSNSKPAARYLIAVEKKSGKVIYCKQDNEKH